MIKRMISAAAALLMLFALAASTSCGERGGGDKAVTLTVMGRKSDTEKSYMKEIFRLYEEATGNHLKVTAIDDAEFEREAARRCASGKMTDLLMHFNNADLNRFSASKNFLTLNDEKWVSDLTDSAAAYCRDADGNIMGLPFWESSVSGCYYNKTLLDSLGMRPATTQAEFDTLCQALVDIGFTPLCWPADGCTWMFQFGLDPVFADSPELLKKLNDEEISYSDIPQVADMVHWVANAADKGWFGASYLREGWSDVSAKLSSGDAVMTFIWDTWFYTDFEQNGKYKVDDFALMPVFMNTADEGTYEGGNLNMMMVNKNGEHIDAALDFLSFCASPENYNRAFDGIPTVSCFKGQTTNIQSPMVQNAAASIAQLERVSTAASKIIGYSADDVAAAFDSLFRKKLGESDCVKLMDEYRIEEAREQGLAGSNG